MNDLPSLSRCGGERECDPLAKRRRRERYVVVELRTIRRQIVTDPLRRLEVRHSLPHPYAGLVIWGRFLLERLLVGYLFSEYYLRGRAPTESDDEHGEQHA